ncbi:MAG TPA: amidohydrolase family protein [Solirubrobacteraceae bacterium]|nr:amidohydrolase family protein [Solirubrobacteraceae bacterium]
MAVNGADFDPRLAPVYADGRELLDGAEWFDAHTHIGHNDPDGRTATAEEIIAGLDQAGHHRALVFPMHEPDGYAPANDMVIAAAAASEGRLIALGRVSPHHEDAVAEARRCLEAGARGFKLHPRSDEFELPHPAVERVVALAHEHRLPVLFHAGRGIPHLGEAVVDYARRYPGARLILAHAGISDLSWIARDAAQLPNLFFDTAWWLVADHLQLYATIPPARILYASDMPYGPGLATAFIFQRVARAVGLDPDAMRAIAGGQLARLMAGEDPVDLGPAPGTEAVGPRVIEAERVVSYCASALQLAFRDQDPSESLALGRLACRTGRHDPIGGLLHYVDRLLEIAQENLAADPETPRAMAPATLLAITIAGTPTAGVPAAEL